MDDDFVCCTECPVIDRHWQIVEKARSMLQHRPPNAETVALALLVLDSKLDESEAW